MHLKNYINLNGELFPSDVAIFNSQNRAFKYGDGLFESIRMINQKMPLFQLHFNRLQQGCSILKLNLPKNFDEKFLEKEILKLTQKQAISNNARIRVSIFRSSGGLYFPTNSQAEFLIEAFEEKEVAFTLNKKGLVVNIYSEIVKPQNIFSSIKTNNALIYILAAIFQNENKLDACLLLNPKSRIIESIDSNIFLVKNNEVVTPHINEGCVQGVMRTYLLELLLKNQIIVREKTIALEELFDADEVFLTNAIRGIRWVKSYKVKNYGNDFSVKLNKMLNEEIMRFNLKDTETTN